MNTILVIAPHPDDETLGCGGTLLKHKQKGDNVNWLIATSISGLKIDDSSIQERKNLINKVSNSYKFDCTRHIDEFGIFKIIIQDFYNTIPEDCTYIYITIRLRLIIDSKWTHIFFN